MEYQKKDSSYDDYRSYSINSLKTQEVPLGSEVQGYRASEKEKSEHSVPVETMRMKNADGILSVGVNRKQEISITITSDSQGPLLRQDRSLINTESAKLINGISDKIYTNSHDPKVSAVLYKEDLKKDSSGMVQNLKNAFETQENEVVSTITPFFLSKEDIQQRKDKEEFLRTSLEKGDTLGHLIMEEELERLRTRISRKEKEENRLIHNLMSVTEKMKEQSQHLDYDYQTSYSSVVDMLSDDGSEEDDGSDEGNAGTEDRNAGTDEGNDENDK